MKQLFIITTLTLLHIISVQAQEKYTLTTDVNQLKVYKENSYDILDLLDANINEIIGAPSLPIKRVEIAIPYNSIISDLKIIDIKEKEIAGEYNIAPVLPPTISSLQYKDSMVVDKTIYNNNTYYPSQIIEYVDNGMLAGTKIATLNYFPARYNPVTKKIKVVVEVTFQVNLKTISLDSHSDEDVLKSRYPSRFLINHIKNKVLNPTFLDQNLNTSTKIQTQQTSNILNPKIDYVIITKDSMSAGFKEIADWKTKKGVYSKIVTTEWIYSNFSGSDSPEKIRNFIKYAFQNWGSIWFLMGGDTDIVPIRNVWISHFNHSDDFVKNHPLGEFIPTDMYYACLDGTWNKDGDQTFGEADWNYIDGHNDTISHVSSSANIDDVDRTPDVFVGRIPVKNNQQLNLYKTKYFKYIKGENVYPNKSLVFSANSDYIESNKMDIVSSRFPNNVNVAKLYECIGSYNSNCGTKSDVYNSLNSGLYHIICGYGHGSVQSFEACYGSISKAEISNLQNSMNQGIILYNNHCETMAWDKDCIGEEYINTSNGGIAYIGNTRLGWTGDPTRYNHNFISNIYAKKQIGKAFYDAKGTGSATDGVPRWGFFSLNISADPEMQIWTNTPQTLDVQVTPSPSRVSEDCFVTVTISNLQNGNSALICIQGGTEIYETKTVNTNGTYTIPIPTPAQYSGGVDVTITAHNCFPVEETVSFNTGRIVDPQISAINFVDNGSYGSIGNGNGKNDAGETICLMVTLKNNSIIPAYNLTATLSTTSDSIAVLNNTYNVGTIPAGGGTAVGQFLYQIDKDIHETLANVRDSIPFELLIRDSNNRTWTKAFNIDVFATDLKQRNKIIAVTSNRDKIIDKNETVYLHIELQNLGQTPATGLTATLASNNPDNIVSSCLATARDYPIINRFETKSNPITFPFTTGSAYTSNSTLNFILAVTNAYGKEQYFSFNLNKPDTVIGLDFTAAETEINLTWNPLSNAGSYNIYRCDVNTVGGSDMESGNYIKLNNEPVTFSFFTDTGLNNLTKYYYKIAAVSPSGMEGDAIRMLAWTSYPQKYLFPVAFDATLGLQRSSVNVADIDFDGKKEIFAVSRNVNNSWIVGLDYQGNELYDIDNNVTTYSGFAELGINAWSVPALADTKKNGEYNVILPSRTMSTGNQLFCYSVKDQNEDQKPDLLWNQPLNANYVRGAVVSNIDNSPDGSMEMVLISSGSEKIISIYDANGALQRNISLSGSPLLYGAIAVADLDGDGDKEIVLAYNTGIYVWHHDGSNFIANKQPIYSITETGHQFHSSVIVCDIDNDGQKEILTTATKRSGSPYEGRIYAVKTNGTLVSGWGGVNQTIPYENTSLSLDISVGDLDNDGKLEVVALGRGVVKIWKNTGVLKDSILISDLTVKDSEAIIPVLADVDGGDDVEIIFGSMVKNNIYAYKHDGNRVLGFPLRQEIETYWNFCIADVDNDGKNELISFNSNKIHMWETNGSSSKIEWGHERHDQFNTGEYYKICEPTIINSNTSWSSNRSICGDIVVKSGTLTINGNSSISMDNSSMIMVMDGATLQIDSGHLLNSNVKILSGGKIILKNNGSVKTRKNGEFNVGLGAIFENLSGQIEITPSSP